MRHLDLDNPELVQRIANAASSAPVPWLDDWWWEDDANWQLIALTVIGALKHDDSQPHGIGLDGRCATCDGGEPADE